QSFAPFFRRKNLLRRAARRAASSRPHSDRVARPVRPKRFSGLRTRAVRSRVCQIVRIVAEALLRLTKLCTAEGRGMLDYNHATSVPFLQNYRTRYAGGVCA